MTRRHGLFLGLLAALSLVTLLVLPAASGEVTLQVVNIETPQGVKVWVPESIFAKKGDTVTLNLINRHPDEHGYEIEAFGIKEVVPGEKSKTITFKVNKAGVFPIKCHLHKAHVAGQIVVLE